MTKTTGNKLTEEEKISKQQDPAKAMKEELRRMRLSWAQQKTIGERFRVPRVGKKPVETILYLPAGDVSGPLPILFNMHGGAWIGGDAVLMESFCQLLADEIPAMVVNVNYTKADVESAPYAVEEVKDAVKYFAANSAAYGINEKKMAVGGHSAGAHLACSAAFALAQEGVELAAQMLVYPVACVDKTNPEMEQFRAMLPDAGWEDPMLSPLNAADEMLKKVAPAIFILCGKDELRPGGIAYAKRLMDLAVPVKVKEYVDAEHGFLEVNRPDYGPGDPRQTPEQEAYCRDCEQYLIRELRASL